MGKDKEQHVHLHKDDKKIHRSTLEPRFTHPHPLYHDNQSLPPNHHYHQNQGYIHDYPQHHVPMSSVPPSKAPVQSQPVIQSQPQSTTNTNIILMPDGKSMPQNVRKWSTGLCGCCSDCGICFCVLFCIPCVVCKMASRMSENCCVPYLPGGMMALRTKLRTLYGIRGSICCDCCEIAYCTYCAICQMDRELDRIGL